MVDNSKHQELYVMMFALQTLHNRGITIKETIYASLKNLLQWYQQSGNMGYLDIAMLHMQAYANMGFALDDQEKTVKTILELTEKTKSDFYPKGYIPGRKIKVSKAQIRGMLGKWKPSKDNPMTIGEVVDDIIGKIKEHRVGHYIYQYQRKISGEQDEPEVYELVINKDESYFYDVKKFKFYTFVED
ncbi:MAG: hypothetical protein Q4D16_24185 [Eubacteriales bacterium]|nr:hypothetical protein [Eubacteriales bacterium]